MGVFEGAPVGAYEGDAVGVPVGDALGAPVGDALGAPDGVAEGAPDGALEGVSVGALDGKNVGNAEIEGDEVGLPLNCVPVTQKSRTVSKSRRLTSTMSFVEVVPHSAAVRSPQSPQSVPHPQGASSSLPAPPSSHSPSFAHMHVSSQTPSSSFSASMVKDKWPRSSLSSYSISIV